MVRLYYVIAFIGVLALAAVLSEGLAGWQERVPEFLISFLVLGIGALGLVLKERELGGGPYALVGMCLNALAILFVYVMISEYSEADRDTLWAGVFLVLLLFIAGISLMRFDFGRAYRALSKEQNH